MATMDDLVRQVQDLEGATTDLLDATNLSKQTLDEAVDSASGSAQSAETDAGTATEQRNEAVVARNEAVAAKDDAEAIVHEGEGSTTPGGGKYPVAYADGQIDSGWLPELRARFPHSGVIGSVSKDDVIWTSQVESFANKIRIRASAWNINGRFVGLVNYDITLAEAEDTAARAIAFDDIFLDWNGNTVQHRSITPHRTTTGYDSDAIATEHGYTKVQNGLYRTSDRATYLLLLGRVARRNQGAYHPVWNPEGANRTRNTETDSFGKYYGVGWFLTRAKQLSSSEDAFDLTKIGAASGNRDDVDSVAGAPDFYGSIVDGFTQHTGGNPNDHKYDAIYAEDFTPLYYSAQNIVDRQALLFDSFNRAVAGETFMGAEGTQRDGVTLTPDQSSTAFYSGIGSRLIPNGAVAGETVYVLIESTGGATLVDGVEVDTLYECVSTYRDSSNLWQQAQLHRVSDDGFTWVTNGNVNNMRVRVYSGRPSGHKQPSARPQFLAVDIIGSLAAMPQEWLDNGLPGNWLAVGEEREDLIPETGINKDYKASRKCLECYLVLHTADRGQSWDDYTTAWKDELESAANSRNARINDDRCLMIFYRTAANPFELSEHTYFHCIQPTATCTQDNGMALLGSNLINKITTVGVPPYVRAYPVITHYSLDARARNRLSSSTNFVDRTTHAEVTLQNLLPAYKCFGYLVDGSLSYHLAVMYKEMRSQNGASGDDSKFRIVTNQSTTTDLNGEQVIVGQKRCQLPYHFDGVTL